MTATAVDIDDLVSLERGEVDRRIFSDPAIFEREMEQIFGRAWLFLCHESQIPEPGDFFASVMGRDNVLVVRKRDGTIRAMLNTCAHRGNAVCRAEEVHATACWNRSPLTSCGRKDWPAGILKARALPSSVSTA